MSSNCAYGNEKCDNKEQHEVQIMAVAALGKLTGLVFEKPGKNILQNVTWLTEGLISLIVSAARLNLDFHKVVARFFFCSL